MNDSDLTASIQQIHEMFLDLEPRLKAGAMHGTESDEHSGPGL
jgi:hypothetical protein